MASRALNRITPIIGPAGMKTYAVAAPLSTHWRPATCEEVDCSNYAAGWRTVVDETEELGRHQAHYIRHQAGRRFVEYWEGGLTTFVFEADQRCFAQHQLPLEREPIYLVREGDWRGNPRGTPTRLHRRAEDWVDDFATHQQQLHDRLERS